MHVYSYSDFKPDYIYFQLLRVFNLAGFNLLTFVTPIYNSYSYIIIYTCRLYSYSIITGVAICDRFCKKPAMFAPGSN